MTPFASGVLLLGQAREALWSLGKTLAELEDSHQGRGHWACRGPSSPSRAVSPGHAIGVTPALAACGSCTDGLRLHTVRHQQHGGGRLRCHDKLSVRTSLFGADFALSTRPQTAAVGVDMQV